MFKLKGLLVAIEIVAGRGGGPKTPLVILQGLTVIFLSDIWMIVIICSCSSTLFMIGLLLVESFFIRQTLPLWHVNQKINTNKVTMLK